MFRFALADAENAESLDTVGCARPDFRPGDTIPQGPGRTLRVVNAIDPEADGQLPVLVVELTD